MFSLVLRLSAANFDYHVHGRRVRPSVAGNLRRQTAGKYSFIVSHGDKEAAHHGRRRIVDELIQRMKHSDVKTGDHYIRETYPRCLIRI